MSKETTKPERYFLTTEHTDYTEPERYVLTQRRRERRGSQKNTKRIFLITSNR